MDRNKLIKYYAEKTNEYNNEIEKITRQLKSIEMIRIVLFCFCLFWIFYFKEEKIFLSWGIIPTAVFPFIWISQYYTKLINRKKQYQLRILAIRNEEDLLERRWSDVNNGIEFKDYNHDFSADLDIFGEHSLFHFINHTSTPNGKISLSKMLLYPLTNKSEIEARQESIQELMKLQDFSRDFFVSSNSNKADEQDIENIRHWLKSEKVISSNRFIRNLPYIILTINTILITLSLFNTISVTVAINFFIFFLILTFSLQRKISSLYNFNIQSLSALAKYEQLLRLIEALDPSTNSLTALKNRLFSHGTPASIILKKLNKIMKLLDHRNNLIVGPLMNGLCWGELWLITRIEKWQQQHNNSLSEWLDVIGETDALLSLSSFCRNNPEYVFPSLTEKSFQYKGERMIHPLMTKRGCIPNNIDISQKGNLLIITGANMAGKSTYLRTIGINYILGCIGCKVCAKSMIFYPASLITDIHNEDSLMCNESYFFSELRKIQYITDRLRQKEEVFILFDEVLKGTNSIDRQRGTVSLLRQMINYNANVILATHDLEVCSIENEHPDRIRNFCFEAEIRDQKLFFSYIIQEGVAKKMNACFLMKQMGILMN